MASADPTPLRFEGLTLDLAARTLVDAGGREVALRRSEFELLRAFLAAPGRALSRDHLLDAVAGRRSDPFDRSVDVLVGRLRRKIEPEPARPRLIVTVPGAGYRFAAKPQPVSAESGATPAMPVPTLPAPPERRQLTILQCGLSGPALLSARGDPEDLQRLLVAFHTTCATIIQRAGGTIAQRLDETVLAYFGYPETHEDEAERAIWAALHLIEAAGAIKTGHASTLQARVGIATGLVLVGDLLGAGSGEPVTLGEAPSLAAGLLARAEPGTVLIGPATRRLVGDIFECRDHTPIPLDGFADPVPAWEVIGEGVKGRFDALRGREIAELVGRAEELSLLLRRWEQVKAGAGRAVLLTGEPGIGKSRLIRAAQDRLASEAPVRPRYFCSPRHRDSALYPVIARIERAAGFGRDDTAETKLTKLEVLLAKSDAGDDATAVFAGLLSTPASAPYRLPETSPQRLREKTLAALLGAFAGIAARKPALVIFEDVHRSDPTTLELLARAVERVASMRVLLLITARPEFKPPWPDQAHVTTLLLNRLSDDEAAMLADHVAGAVSLPGTTRQQIVEHAEGVPLFVEELTKAVLEIGFPAEEERSVPPPIPTSLQDLLEARLERLGPAREVAQIGAVIGREFTDELLSAVTGQPDTALEQALRQLVRSELLFRSGTPPDARYAFKHALVQQAAYESLPRSRRAALHVRVSEALIELDPSTEITQPDLLAWHYEQGGVQEKAISYYTHAGWRSASRSAYAEGRRQCARALRLIATLPEGAQRDRMDLEALACLSEAIVLQRGYANTEAIDVQVRAQELWERLGRPAEFVGVIRDRWQFHFTRSETRLAQDLADKLLHSSRRRADAQYTILGHTLAGGSALVRGEFLESSWHLQEGLRLVQSCSDDPGYLWRSHKTLRGPWTAWAHITTRLGYVRCWLGYPDQAVACLSSLVERAPTMGWAPALAVYSILRGTGQFVFHRWRAARPASESTWQAGGRS